MWCVFLSFSDYCRLLQQTSWHDRWRGQGGFSQGGLPLADFRLCILWSEGEGCTESSTNGALSCHLLGSGRVGGMFIWSPVWWLRGKKVLSLLSQQTSEPSFPDIVRIAVSKEGLTIIHPKSKVKNGSNSTLFPFELMLRFLNISDSLSGKGGAGKPPVQPYR